MATAQEDSSAAVRSKRRAELRDFAEYGMMQTGDEMQFMVQNGEERRMISATVGWHPGKGWRLFVPLVELGTPDEQSAILEAVCSKKPGRLSEVLSELDSKEYIVVSVSTFVHIGRSQMFVPTPRSYEDKNLFVTRCAAVGHTDGSFKPIAEFREIFENQVEWGQGKPPDGREPTKGGRVQGEFLPGRTVYVPGQHGGSGAGSAAASSSASSTASAATATAATAPTAAVPAAATALTAAAPAATATAAPAPAAAASSAPAAAGSGVAGGGGGGGGSKSRGSGGDGGGGGGGGGGDGGGEGGEGSGAEGSGGGSGSSCRTWKGTGQLHVEGGFGRPAIQTRSATAMGNQPCFPSSATVQRADGKTAPLSSLKTVLLSSLSAGTSILTAAANGTLVLMLCERGFTCFNVAHFY